MCFGIKSQKPCVCVNTMFRLKDMMFFMFTFYGCHTLPSGFNYFSVYFFISHVLKFIYLNFYEQDFLRKKVKLTVND